ncbi:MAG TPA: hypothetical protein VGH93_05770 [Solirubrobacteraceae bacterium]
MPGVLGSDPGPSGVRVTADPASGPLIGVSATAQSDDRYAIDLSLVADMVPLPALAEDVRARVRRRADGERLGAVLGAVNVEFASVVTAEEFAVAAAEQQVEEAILAEELAAGAAIAEEAAEATAPGPGSVRGEAPEAVAAPASAGGPREGERPLGAPVGEATPRGRDAAAALAARQAALATDQAALAAKQAALAAKQAALAAEQATLAGERAALAADPAALLPSLASERAAGSVAEDAGERQR